jgi:hypothetical protein
VTANDALFFRTSDLQLDLDGSPNAYGSKDQGLENICNGLGPLLPPECRGNAQGPCFSACQTAFRQWNDARSAHKVSASLYVPRSGSAAMAARHRTCGFRNLLARNGSSATSLQLRPPELPRLGQWIQTQPAQLDPRRFLLFRDSSQPQKPTLGCHSRGRRSRGSIYHRDGEASLVVGDTVGRSTKLRLGCLRRWQAANDSRRK